MELQDDNYREIFGYFNDKEIFKYSLVCKRWKNILESKRCTLKKYGLEPEITEYATIKHGKYKYPEKEWPDRCKYVIFHPNQRFEININDRDPSKTQELIDEIITNLNSYDLKIEIFKEEIVTATRIRYNVDITKVCEEVEKLGFGKVISSDYWDFKAFEYIEIVNNHTIRLFIRKIIRGERFDLIFRLEGFPYSLHKKYQKNIMDIFERLKLPLDSILQYK